MLGLAKHRQGQNTRYEYTQFHSSGTIVNYFNNFYYPELTGGSATARVYAGDNPATPDGIELTAGTWQVKISGTINMAYQSYYPQLLSIGPFFGIDSPEDNFINVFYYNTTDSAPELAEGANKIVNNQINNYYNEFANFPGPDYTLTLTETKRFPLYFNLLPDGVDSVNFTVTWDMTVIARRTIL